MHSQYFLLSLFNHVRYKCVRTAGSMPTPSSARRIGIERDGMTFEEILDHAMAMLQRRGRLTYGTLKRQFQLDDTTLEDLKEALLFAHPQIADEAGRGPVWTGDPATVSVPISPPAPDLLQTPLTYTPSY